MKSEDQVNQLEAISIAPAPEISVLDEILLESGGLSLRSDQASDGGGEQKKEVSSCFNQIYLFAFHSFLFVTFFAVIDKQAWVVTGGREEISSHFHELVPDMALDFPFELDTFQKEVIILLLFSQEVTSIAQLA